MASRRTVLYARGSVDEATSVRGLGRLMKLSRTAEERRSRVREDGGGFKGRSGSTGGCWMDSVCRWRRSASVVVTVVAVLRAGATENVVRFCYEFQFNASSQYCVWQTLHSEGRALPDISSNNVDVCRAFSLTIDQGPRFSSAFFVPARRDNFVRSKSHKPGAATCPKRGGHIMWDIIHWS